MIASHDESCACGATFHYLGDSASLILALKAWHEQHKVCVAPKPTAPTESAKK